MWGYQSDKISVVSHDKASPSGFEQMIVNERLSDLQSELRSMQWKADAVEYLASRARELRAAAESLRKEKPRQSPDGAPGF